MTVDIERVLARMGRCPYGAHHGMTIVAVDTGMARIQFKVPSWAENAAGVCHGGAIFALADFAQAVACHTIGREIAMQGNINWIGSARAGDTLTAEARVLHTGRRTFVTSVEVHDQRGRRIAQATFTAARLPDDGRTL